MSRGNEMMDSRTEPRPGVRRSTQSGQVALEMIGFVVVVMIAALLALQGVLLAQTHSAVQEAARHGARVYSDPSTSWAEARTVADNALPSWADPVVIDGSRSENTARVEITVAVPIGSTAFSFDGLTITRDAEFAMGG